MAQKRTSLVSSAIDLLRPDELAELVELIAEFMHRQWAHCTDQMLDEYTPENVHQWRRQIETPFEDLPPEEKEINRILARRLLEELVEKL